MVGGGQCSSITVVVLTLLGDNRGAPSGWRIIHSNNNNNNNVQCAICCLSNIRIVRLTPRAGCTRYSDLHQLPNKSLWHILLSLSAYMYGDDIKDDSRKDSTCILWNNVVGTSSMHVQPFAMQ